MVAGWPGSPAFVVGRATAHGYETLVSLGRIDHARPWASVSKLTVGIAAMRVVASGDAFLSDPAGPEGSTLAHLLSHASGLGFEEGDRVVPVGTRRVYSNAGIDCVGDALAPDDPRGWITETVLIPLGTDAVLADRISAGVVGTVHDMALLANELLVPTLLTPAQRDTMTTPFLPELDGITPPFGRQRPNWWGLGPELKGQKQHWMGNWPADSFGHFGQSGALLLCDPTTQLFVAATSTERFGPWAVELWPQWLDALREEVSQ